MSDEQEPEEMNETEEDETYTEDDTETEQEESDEIEHQDLKDTKEPPDEDEQPSEKKSVSSEMNETEEDETYTEDDTETEQEESDEIEHQDLKDTKEPPDEDEQPSEKKSVSSEKSSKTRSETDYRLRNIFVRPRYAEPKHPVFSSLFVRHISDMAFGPKKPKWYTPLTSAQLYLFKDIMNYVEIGREALFRFDDFLEALQDFEPSIREEEVIDILDSMEKNEFEELDFGKFLFLLAYRDHPADMDDPGEIDKTLSRPIVTPRQCLILSAICYYVLIASPEEIERYYVGNTRRKATVLHYHMEASRLQGLTETQMEERQKKAMRHLGPLFAVTGSPYAYPVPFVPQFKKTKFYREWSDRRLSRPKTALPVQKKSISRPIKPIKPSRKLGDPVEYKTEDDRTFYNMHYGRLPMPIMNIPGKKRKEMRKKCTVEMKDYITRKAYEALADYRNRLKKATVLYNKRSLEIILGKGFPTDSEEQAFIEVFERYMPLQLSDVKNFSLWVKPAGYELKHDGKPLNPEKYAFGSKLP